MTSQAYQALGGARGALALHAEATYGALASDADRALARALFLRLIDPGLTEQDTTRRRAAISEFVLPDPQRTARLEAVAQAFIAARLLVTARSRFGGDHRLIDGCGAGHHPEHEPRREALAPRGSTCLARPPCDAADERAGYNAVTESGRPGRHMPSK